ncbi:MAG: hypothetical protein D8M58_10940 [Calditrichaeota bacterium]|nr:MAG: hypothetical protein DWQ03_10315 [Calditrichota bacterium]MBL1205908.1 hypothetical protein [Calditrichota bacterium]NOG45736.1 hypothetical protein [Calditrichota bacterium]
MSFKGVQKVFSYTQVNNASPEKVFQLLCPVREKEWLDGWDCKMIHSKSGIIEKNCVFTTPHHGESETVWHVTNYDPEKYEIEFFRVTPNETTVRINIKLSSKSNSQTNTYIEYLYTALNEQQNEIIKYNLENSFIESMLWWESAINHFLKTGKMLVS